MENAHIVLFPFMAQGHIIPFLSLAKLLEQRKPNCTITLVSSPLNIAKLQPSLPLFSSIRLAELPFRSSDHGLPPDSENTEALPLHLHINFFLATETLRPSFENLVSDIIKTQGHHRVLVIADPFLSWTVESAKKLRVFHSVFGTSGAYGSAIFLSLWMHPPPIHDTSSEEVPLIDFPDVRLRRSQITNTIVPGDGTDPMTAFMKRQIALSLKTNAFLVNTVEELEKKGLLLFRKLTGAPVWPVGPLVRLPSSSSSITTEFADENCVNWLDNRPPSSVLYVSFGSQNSISISEMTALAKALEASQKPFIWVVRPPVGFEDWKEFNAEWLPKGFTERMKEAKQGMLVQGWAPQTEILAHRATGAFLSHCGWNSVLESLSNGVPIIGWPLMADQLYNVKVLEEMGVCVEVARGRGCNDGLELEKGWEGLKNAFEVVLGKKKEGREMRKKAEEIGKVIRRALREGEDVEMGSSLRAMEDFFKSAISYGKV